MMMKRSTFERFLPVLCVGTFFAVFELWVLISSPKKDLEFMPRLQDPATFASSRVVQLPFDPRMAAPFTEKQGHRLTPDKEGRLLAALRNSQQGHLGGHGTVICADKVSLLLGVGDGKWLVNLQALTPTDHFAPWFNFDTLSSDGAVWTGCITGKEASEIFTMLDLRAW